MAGLAVTFITAYCCLRRKDKKKEAVWKDQLHEKVHEVHTHHRSELERRKSMVVNSGGLDGVNGEQLANLHPELVRALSMSVKALADKQRLAASGSEPFNDDISVQDNALKRFLSIATTGPAGAPVQMEDI